MHKIIFWANHVIRLLFNFKCFELPPENITFRV